MNTPTPLDDARVEALVARYVEDRFHALREELHAEMVVVANKLRQDDSFMKPAAQKFTDHAGDHLFDKAARRLLLFVIGVLGAGGMGLVVFLSGRGFK